MKTPFIALIALLASTPAGASINTSQPSPVDLTPQPVVYGQEPVVQPDKCGKPQQLLFILRDPNGAIVAMGVAEVRPAC